MGVKYYVIEIEYKCMLQSGRGKVAGRACGGNHHPGSIPSSCGNYPASSGHQSGTGFDPTQVKPSRMKWTAA
ncbi:hypothetical protein F2Q69_00030751 [Brassica cretica]|uniref:Uncharacterized protein n=1 Tax=Brassica cretica TaxID=69181 RepID=A0A8S9S6W3_BRACR|nr:hypothetical protein F2Q69_00030751 [Brassica cretica]